jgi:ATP-dependent RNA helicase HelY
VPVTAIERIRIPTWFSARSARHRRDLAATVQNKLAAAGLGKGGPRGRARGGPPGLTAAEEDLEIAALRRQLRAHPCHSCPERDEHARQAEEYLRIERQAESLESRVAGRSHVIARTFDRVCAVLTELGYLAGDQVTEEGRRLGGLYTELDLLAAECLRRGLWDGLSPAELAACVSALSFESRRSDEASPPRLPGGQVRGVLASMISLWADLDKTEQEHRLSFLREPDAGFAWPAHAWAQGRPLEAVLATGLTPGDFVRAAKQLIDLLDQVGAAAGGGVGAAGVASTARKAVSALRRGIVAYSSVG